MTSRKRIVSNARSANGNGRVMSQAKTRALPTPRARSSSFRDLQLRRIVVDAHDRLAVLRGLQQVRGVAGADVEHAVGGRQVRDIPVVPGLIHQVLGVDRVRALAGELDQPDADGLAAAVHEVDAADQQAGEAVHRAPRGP